MSEEGRYLRVGLFVLLGMALLAGVLVLLGGRSVFRERRIVETSFAESVQGLDVGSAVKFRGFTIGRVKDIGIAAQYYDFGDLEETLEEGRDILVRMEIEPPAAADPIPLENLVAAGARTRLAQQGITGAAYIEVDLLGDEAPPAPALDWIPEYPYIPSVPSRIKQLTSAAERIFDRLDQLDVETIAAHLDDLLVTAKAGVDGLALGKLQARAVAVLDDLRKTTDDLRTTIAKADLDGLGTSAKQTLDKTTGAVVRVERLLDGSRYDIEATLENLRVTTENLRELTDTLRHQPSLLLRSEAPKGSPGR